MKTGALGLRVDEESSKAGFAELRALSPKRVPPDPVPKGGPENKPFGSSNGFGAIEEDTDADWTSFTIGTGCSLTRGC